MTKVSRLIREPEVLARVPFSSPTLHRRVKDGSFPAPVKIGARARAWVEKEIDEWELARITERDEDLATKHTKVSSLRESRDLDEEAT